MRNDAVTGDIADGSFCARVGPNDSIERIRSVLQRGSCETAAHGLGRRAAQYAPANSDSTNASWLGRPRNSVAAMSADATAAMPHVR